nr:hypothetical protein CFP56_12520 [Quercus suber]
MLEVVMHWLLRLVPPTTLEVLAQKSSVTTVGISLLAHISQCSSSSSILSLHFPDFVTDESEFMDGAFATNDYQCEVDDMTLAEENALGSFEPLPVSMSNDFVLITNVGGDAFATCVESVVAFEPILNTESVAHNVPFSQVNEMNVSEYSFMS